MTTPSSRPPRARSGAHAEASSHRALDQVARRAKRGPFAARLTIESRPICAAASKSRRNAATLMRRRRSGVTSIVSRAAKGPRLRRGRGCISRDLIQRSASLGRDVNLLLRLCRRAHATLGRRGCHRTILPTSAAKALTSRTAERATPVSRTRRPVFAASAKATRWPMRWRSIGGS